MKHEKKRITKIIDELMFYLFSMGANNIDVNFKREADLCAITFKSDYDLSKRDKLFKLVKFLNYEKQEEMEEYYWELTGNYDLDTELSLVGMMIDEAKIYYDDEKIEIVLLRYN